jgi:RNA polymerase sigma-70 factor, ECF subfamily
MEKDPLTVEAAYRSLRPHAFAVAYRMLGTVSEAEDVVQDAFVRLHGVDTGAIDSPRAYLTTVVTRLALDRLRSAKVRREEYFGPWLPEPIVEAASADEPGGEELSMAFLVLLESLSPVERAVFVLREVFAYEYDAIAAIVDKSADNCRQIATRARRHVDERRPRFEASAERRQELARRFFAAAQAGDVDGLVAMLAADATFTGDGGGKARGYPKPIVGADAVARLMRGFFAKLAPLDARAEEVRINGQPGLVGRDRDGRVINVLVLDVLEGGVIGGVRSVVNPEKLAHLGPVSDLLRVE